MADVTPFDAALCASCGCTGCAPIVVGRPDGMAARLNWLRAGVLGANDGIVSVAAVLVGVAAATPHPGALIAAGIAAITGGAISMALGEYVSVSSQRDSERAAITRGEIRLSDHDVVNPWHAALASAVSFLAGGIWPLLVAVVVGRPTAKVPAIVAVVLLTLAAAGLLASRIGQSDAWRSTLRMVVGGALAMAVTWGIGALLGQSGAL